LSASDSETSQIVADFRSLLLSWYHEHKRDLPWRNTGDPYAIWVSEIMLQQTRVDQALPYYTRWMEAFPEIASLANADRQEVLMLWEGLGYYSRARNMQDAAKTVMEQFGGNFPSHYDDIIKLKGIGPYTAAAISSIAFNQPKAVVDGNVIRVISRWSGIEEDVSKGGVIREIQSIADDLLDASQPGEFNQAMMELGATVCTPKNPKCNECPVSFSCVATQMAKTDSIPYKVPKKKVPHHQIVVGICVDSDGNILIALRPEEKMLGGLWEFPGGKVESGESLEGALKRELLEELSVEVSIHPQKLTEIKHTYSHFKITLHAFYCFITSGEAVPKASKILKWIKPAELDDYPFPKANRTLTQILRERPLPDIEF